MPSVTKTPTERNRELARLLLAEAERRSKRGLGRVSTKGWHQRDIRCPCGLHAHDDKSPSCSVKQDGSLYCHTTARYYSQREAAALLRVTVPEGEGRFNRQQRRSAASRSRPVARREKQRLLARTVKEVPRRLRRLMRLLIHQSARFGTVAMSQPEMGKRLGLTRETVNRQIAELRALGFSSKLGYYVIGFNPELHHHGLEMRVCIESVVHSEQALDLWEKNHTIRLIRLFANGSLPKFVFMTGLSAIIHYQFGGTQASRSRPPPSQPQQLSLT